MQEKELYIIGAGISGLIAACELEQAGYHPIIIEKSGKVGGRVKTLEEGGYALDLGFQVLLSAYPMAQKYLDLDSLRLRKLESGALIYVNGKSYRIGDPLRNWSVLFPTLFADIGSVGDKFKILKLNRYLSKKSLDEIFGSEEMSTLDYLRNYGFSDKIIDRFFRPFFAGIFLEPELSTSSRMFEFVYKMFGEGYATIPEKGIGAISEQLKEKLQKTTFMFDCEVEQVTSEKILLKSGKELPHQGVIIASEASSLIQNMNDQGISWKSCMCLYFEVDQTNIPDETIALIADPDKLSNNLYAYKDHSSGKTILSVTSLKYQNLSDQEIQDKISDEVKAYTGAKDVKHIKSYRIDHALPDIQNLRSTAQPEGSRLLDKVFLAGDYLFNGSLNAAMESGKLAALGLIGKPIRTTENA